LSFFHQLTHKNLRKRNSAEKMHNYIP